MKRYLTAGTITVAMLLGAACGDPQRTLAGFSLQLAQSSAASAAYVPAVGLSTGAGITLETAEINVSRLAFKSAPGACDGSEDGGPQTAGGAASGDQYRPATTSEETAETVHADCTDGFLVVNGPFRINLLTGESTPSLGAISMVAGTYRWVDLHLAAVTDEADAMHGLSVSASGIYESDATTAALNITMDLTNPPLRLKPADGIVVGEEDGVDIVAVLQATDVFAGIADDLGQCLESPNPPLVDGVIQITGTSGGACDRVNGTLRQNLIGAGTKAGVTVRGPQ